MTSFADLSERPYGGIRDARVLAVGWLDTGVSYWHDPKTQPPPRPVVFEREPPTQRFVEQLVLVTRENHALGWRTGGFHICNLEDCDHAFGKRAMLGLSLGSWQVWVRHPREPAVLFCAPDLLLHYVVDHHYKPPGEFVEAVLAYRAGDLPIIDTERGFELRAVTV